LLPVVYIEINDLKRAIKPPAAKKSSGAKILLDGDFADH
jgi:hypothetical protein